MSKRFAVQAAYIMIKIPEKQSEKLAATGCLATGSGTGVIRSTPLGSCVAVVAYDKTLTTGGIAHIMLPGKSPTEDKVEENKYAQNAIENLLGELKRLGSKSANVEICLLGGANVLRKENDTIADNLIFSIIEIVERKKLPIKRTSLGGYERRTAKLTLHSGMVTFTLGDKSEAELFDFITGNTGDLSDE